MAHEAGPLLHTGEGPRLYASRLFSATLTSACTRPVRFGALRVTMRDLPRASETP